MAATGALSADRYDEQRRAWIAAHQGWSTIQRRRAETLGRRVRTRQRAVASAVPDPHDDTALPPLVLRTHGSPAARVELIAVLIVLTAVPLGWLAGWILKHTVQAAIPGTLRGYPIASLLWSGALLGGVLVLLYDPAPTLRQALVVPWLCLQLAAVPAVTGVYGLAEGWLAVPGSTRWWPLTPPKRPLSAQDAAAVLGGYDLTGPGVFDARSLNEVGERSRP